MIKNNKHFNGDDEPIKPDITIEYDENGNPIEPPHDGLG